MASKTTIAEGQVRISSKGTKELAGGLKKIAVGFAAIMAGREVLNFFKDSVKLYMEQDAAINQLNATLISMGNKTGYSTNSLVAMAQEMQNLCGVSADLIIEQQAIMATFSKISGEIFPQAMDAALNLSFKYQGDLKSSIIQVGKALNDPIKGIGALSRVGVQFSDTQKDMIKQMVTTNDIAGAQAIIMGELETQVENAAKAYGQSLQGKMDRINASFSDIKKGIGQGIVEGLSFGETLDTVLTGVQGSAMTTQEAIATFTAGAVQSIINVVKFFGNGFQELAKGMEIIVLKIRYGLELAWEAIKGSIGGSFTWFINAVKKHFLEVLATVMEGLYSVGIQAAKVGMISFDVVDDIRAASSKMRIEALRAGQDMNDAYGSMADGIKGVMDEYEPLIAKAEEAYEVLGRNTSQNLWDILRPPEIKLSDFINIEPGTIQTDGGMGGGTSFGAELGKREGENFVGMFAEVVGKNINENLKLKILEKAEGMKQAVEEIMTGSQSKLIEESEKMKEIVEPQFKHLGNSISSILVNGLADGLKGKKDFMKDMLSKFLNLIMNFIMNYFTGGLGGIFSGFFGKIFGGSSTGIPKTGFGMPQFPHQGSPIIINVNALDGESVARYFSSHKGKRALQSSFRMGMV